MSFRAETKSKPRKPRRRRPSPKHSAEDPKEEDVGRLPDEDKLLGEEELGGTRNEVVLPEAEDSRQTGALETLRALAVEVVEPPLHSIRQYGCSWFSIFARRTYFPVASSFSRRSDVNKMPTRFPTRTSATHPRRVLFTCLLRNP